MYIQDDVIEIIVGEECQERIMLCLVVCVSALQILWRKPSVRTNKFTWILRIVDLRINPTWVLIKGHNFICHTCKGMELVVIGRKYCSWHHIVCVHLIKNYTYEYHGDHMTCVYTEYISRKASQLYENCAEETVCIHTTNK